MSYKFSLPQRVNKLFTGIADFDVRRQLGTGALSTVYEGVHRQSGKMFAVKKIDLNKIGVLDQENVEKEIEAHKLMDHKHIAKLYDFFMEGRIVYLVLEYCRSGNLFRYINRHIELSEGEAKRIFKQTCEGIAYMHGLGYINRDLKPENLLLDEDNNIKICDLGWACHLSESAYRKLKAGTYAYMAPECLVGDLQDEAADVWSLGILLFELLYNKEPFSGVSCNDQLKKVKTSRPDFLKRNISEEAKQLISQILQLEKNCRPSLNAIIGCNYLKDAYANNGKGNGNNPSRLFNALDNTKRDQQFIGKNPKINSRPHAPMSQFSSPSIYHPKENLKNPSVTNIYALNTQHVSRNNSTSQRVVLTTSRPVSIEDTRRHGAEPVNPQLYNTISHYTSSKYLATPRSMRYNASATSVHEIKDALNRTGSRANIYVETSGQNMTIGNVRHSNMVLNNQSNRSFHTPVMKDYGSSRGQQGLYSTVSIGSGYSGPQTFMGYRSKRGI